MNYELLIDRARHAAKEPMCLVKPRHLHQMADALENQEKVIKSLEEIIWKQDRAIAGMCDGGCAELRDERDRFDRLSDFEVAEAQELAKVKAELASVKYRLEWAQAERNIAQKRMIELEQELAQIKEVK